MRYKEEALKRKREIPCEDEPEPVKRPKLEAPLCRVDCMYDGTLMQLPLKSHQLAIPMLEALVKSKQQFDYDPTSGTIIVGGTSVVGSCLADILGTICKTYPACIKHKDVDLHNIAGLEEFLKVCIQCLFFSF